MHDSRLGQICAEPVAGRARRARPPETGIVPQVADATLRGDYALGWDVASRSWRGGKVLTHAGDNTMNCADVWLAPNKDFAILLRADQSGDKAFQACDDATAALMSLLAKQ